MHEDILIGLTLVVLLGGIAQWFAWRINLPAILFLLLLGFIAGPVTGILQPDHVFGDLLFPLISLSVAIILFEGGLTLNIRELRESRHTVLNLVSVGVFVTWALANGGGIPLSRLLFPACAADRAILVVTGPTVVIPMLRNLRLVGKLGPVAKWEGIVNDPIGAMLAVLVFESIRSSTCGPRQRSLSSGS